MYGIYNGKKINELIESGNIEQALKLQGQLYLIQKSEYISTLIGKRKLSEALKVCNQYEDYEPMQSQKVTILMKQGKLQEAFDVCSQKKYAHNHYFIRKKQKIKQKMKKIKKDIQNDNLSVCSNSNNINSILLTKIYCNSVLLDEIEKEKIDEWSKIILLIAYYEKNNRKKGINIIKEFRKTNTTTLEQSKILNILLEKLKNKKTLIFDPTVYSKYLNCHIDDQLTIELLGQQEKLGPVIESSIIKTETISKEQKKIDVDFEQNKKVKSKKMIVVEGKRVGDKNNSKLSFETTVQATKNTSNILIKDVFKDEVLEVGKYLYVQMRNLKIQASAVAAWDRFEVLINKPVSDRIALEKMIAFLKRIENSTSVTISLDEKKYTKYLER